MQPEEIKYIAIFECPECEELSDQVDYEVSTTGWESGNGSPDIDTNGELRDWFDTEWGDSGDTDWDGSPTYKCPECEHEMNKADTIRQFKSYKTTAEHLAAYRRGDITLRDIIENANSIKAGKKTRKATTTATQTKPEKIDAGSSILIFKGSALGADANMAFVEHGIQCPNCKNIQASCSGEKYFTCIECDHEFTITNLRESLQNG